MDSNYHAKIMRGIEMGITQSKEQRPKSIMTKISNIKTASNNEDRRMSSGGIAKGLIESEFSDQPSKERISPHRNSSSIKCP
jgi:hypothetical protein